MTNKEGKIKVHAVLGQIAAIIVVLGVFLLVAVPNIARKVGLNDTASLQTGPTQQFKITELGVSITVPASLADLSYITDSTSVPGTTFVYFSTTTLQHLDDAITTKCDPAQGAIGAIWKVAQDPRTLTGIQMSAYKQLGNSYLVYEAPQGLCTSNLANQKLELSQTASLQQAIATATEAQ